MYTYSFIMCIEFHVACMQTNFSEGTTPHNRLSRPVCSKCSFTTVLNKSKNPNLKKLATQTGKSCAIFSQQ